MVSFVKKLSELDSLNSSHLDIRKHIFFNELDCSSNITQIAFTQLNVQEKIETHCYETMEEIFFILG